MRRCGCQEFRCRFPALHRQAHSSLRTHTESPAVGGGGGEGGGGGGGGHKTSSVITSVSARSSQAPTACTSQSPSPDFDWFVPDQGIDVSVSVRVSAGDDFGRRSRSLSPSPSSRCFISPQFVAASHQTPLPHMSHTSTHAVPYEPHASQLLRAPLQHTSHSSTYTPHTSAHAAAPYVAYMSCEADASARLL